jgi:hypothetical protein
MQEMVFLVVGLVSVCFVVFSVVLMQKNNAGKNGVFFTTAFVSC